jgi:hypothetical protein
VERYWSRGEFLRNAAGGAALLALGSGSSAGRLFGTAEALGATPAKPLPVRAFHSRPDLHPPAVTVLRAGATADGSLFIAPSSGPGQRGVLILDNAGDVVWFRSTMPNTAMNFRAGVYKGEPVLTWWEGKAGHGLGVGEHVIFDSSYREVARFPAGRGRRSDLHELRLTEDDTALVTSYEVRTMDTTAFGGTPNGKVVGGIVQEIHVPSARVLFEWKSLDHVALGETHAAATGSLDYFHVNSIDIDGDGDLIVSARNTWAVYKISRKTGQVLWRLGGRRSDYAMGKGTVFAWQHDARHHAAGGLLTIFDDGAAPAVAPQSRALVIALDRERRRATLVRKYTHKPGRLLSKFMGNAQLLDNGNVLVGWGSEPFITEFGPKGDIRLDAKLPDGGQNYRAFRFPWIGRPVDKPKLARARFGDHKLYASWNGATEVASWQLRAGASTTALQVVDTVPRSGFETAIDPPGHGYAVAVPLSAHGKPLGSSDPVRI